MSFHIISLQCLATHKWGICICFYVGIFIMHISPISVLVD
ncbi:hypothetical protein VCRLGP7_920088 [Vibrio crassostreae]|nr:hypothetical protein VCRLGP7_920088 [Vibrio crassostreae]